MSTLRGMHAQAQTLAYYTRLQEVAAHNIANASTSGFKIGRLSGQMAAEGEFPVPVHSLDLAQGALRDTGRPLDLALSGDGFLVVQTPTGERLTRGGSFRLDPAGRVVTSDGQPLLGQDGPVVVPPSGALEVQGDGTVLVDGAPIARLRLETVADPQGLRKEGNSRFLSEAPTQPAGSVTVRQGTLEDANGDAVLGMVDLVTIQRAYAANADALKAMDDVLRTVAGDIGFVR